MRDWSRTLPGASWRGFPFHVELEDLAQSGREIALHQFVKSEEHATEDMGRKPRRYRVDGYVVGDDADSQARALVELCSTAGDGPLRLPLLGSLTVKCDNCTCSMRKDELGRIKVVMDFIESGNDSAFVTIAIGDRLAGSALGEMAGAVGGVISSFAG